MFQIAKLKNTKKLLSFIGLTTASLTLPHLANATIVEFQTSQGNFQVNLFDQTTPKTVENFLSYVNDGYYTDTVVHRVATDFVVQAGGYEFEGAWPLTRLTPMAPVINEPIYSNVTGTIAMAKLGGDVNSASDQWFFNLADNSDNLDFQNGGFTVFGQVIDDPDNAEDGMAIVNKIAELRLCTYDTLVGIPMVVNEDQVCSDMQTPGVENFVVIEQITIVDSSAVTDSELSPILSLNTDTDNDGVIDSIDAFPNDPTETVDTDLDGVGNNADDDDDNDGVLDINDAFPLDATKSEADEKDDGGSTTFFSLIALSFLALRKRFRG
ncbi:peptidylprolyl isomerase [Colwellia sp. E2M01]|uniref:peptidylprolyl isomerase n=1 Tax=Colwellia sp. E2M01 TaxID=2841561 RepID=UPI001C096A69|nr:peptidylprolyl isomerase [Colwellia sp. E2M01]MBU2871775.1 peptidylprolyl isomerase [Colwellia sp. E2M01]